VTLFVSAIILLTVDLLTVDLLTVDENDSVRLIKEVTAFASVYRSLEML